MCVPFLQDTDPVLWYLTTWAQAVVELAVLYRNGEGPAPFPDRRSPEGRRAGRQQVQRPVVPWVGD